MNFGGKKKTQTKESRIVRTKQQTSYSSPVHFLDRLVNNPVQAATVIRGLAAADRHGVSDFPPNTVGTRVPHVY